MKTCMRCAKEIADDAFKCNFCGHIMGSPLQFNTEFARKIVSGTSKKYLSLIIPGLGQISNGDIGVGLAFLLGGGFAYYMNGFLGILVAVISVFVCKPKTQCGNCRSKIESEANICPSCKAKLN